MAVDSRETHHDEAQPGAPDRSDAGPDTGTEATRPSLGVLIGRLIRRPESGAFIGTIGVYIFFIIFGGESFVSAGGTASWLNVAAELGIVALPVGLIMIAGELDLSVGATLVAGSLTFAVTTGHFGLPAVLGILLAIGLGAAVGMLNGVLVTRTQVPSFVVTLATAFGLVGLTLTATRWITGTTNVIVAQEGLTKTLLGTLIDNKFEVAIFWWIGVIVVVAWVLHVTPFGNWIFAVGGDVESAVKQGIPVQRVKIALFMASGTAASFIGIVQASLYSEAQVRPGFAFVFNTIIAVVIGGVLLTGGYGSAIGIAFGTLTFAVVNQGIFYTSFNPDTASLILGVLLLAAVLLNNTFRKLALSAPSARPPSRVANQTEES